MELQNQNQNTNHINIEKRELPKPYERYKHFKGNLYQVIAVAKDCEDGSLKVVYQALYGDYQIYVRDMESFMSLTDRTKYPNAEQKYRFEKASGEVIAVQSEQKVETAVAVESPNEIKQTNSNVADALASEDEFDLDPAIAAYLAAEGTDERLEILRGVRDRVTPEMLATMSIVTDIELSEGSVEEQYQSLLNCLLMKQKYEKVRRY